MLLAQLAHWLDGSYGAAVIVMAIVVRLTLLPVTLHAAELAWHRQRTLARLKPGCNGCAIVMPRIRLPTQRHCRRSIASTR
ncbi:hypothetical protein [Dyella flava]|uniref:hypothetical protein n=1 Tax=Dyella flava TaxID=1920170 RepID=UPI0024E0A9FD|nr:hypothetical protein [Dyella flava]